jgi:hypothetical protein
VTRLLRTLDLTALGSHPWVRLAPDALFLVPVPLLEVIANSEATDTTDTGDGSGRQFPLDEIWQGILKQGMRDPLIVKIGLAPGLATIRLESGNHRIRSAKQSGLTHLPAIGIASAQPILHRGNGEHTVPLDRSGIDAWLEAGGRDPALFEPYPHPVDLRAAFQGCEGADGVVQARDVELIADGVIGVVRAVMPSA